MATIGSSLKHFFYKFFFSQNNYYYKPTKEMLTRKILSSLCDVVALFSQASLPHSSAMISSVKGAYGFEIFFFSRGQGGRFRGAVSESPDVCMEVCKKKFVLNSRVKPCLCSDSSLIHFPFVSFFCLSSVKFDICF